MKSNELRIGNLFIDAKNRLCSVDEIHENIEDCRIASIHDCITSLPIKPIPLTEEWLLKFGFDKDEELGYRWYLGYNRTTILVYDLDDKCIKVSETWEFGTREYVHQLQNLYFALTGEELIFKK